MGDSKNMRMKVTEEERAALFFELERPPGQRKAQLIAAVERILWARCQEVEKERDEWKSRYAELSNALSWDTTCLNCSRMIARSYEDFVKREQLEKALEALVDEWTAVDAWGARVLLSGPEAAEALRNLANQKEDR